jgi:hypothetical protein
VQILYANNNACPPQILKPSSLNYKISLKQAVEEFIKKESKIDDFTIVVDELSK